MEHSHPASADFALASQRVVLPDGVHPATLLISGDTISAILPYPPHQLAVPLEDVSPKVIMPGLIDAHVHINEPGRTHWEGFDTATRAAAAGGITSLIDMPLNSSPVTTSPEALQQKMEAARQQIHVHCGFYGGLVPQNVDSIQALLDSPVLGVKAFLAHSGIDEFPNVSKGDLQKAMPPIAASGLPLLVHCELEAARAVPPIRPEKTRQYTTWLHSRPDSWEVIAIRQMIELCAKTHCRTHIVHLASQQALPAIRQAKTSGLPLTVESCPHYLYFDAETIPEGATQFKCAPPIRKATTRAALWQALAKEEIDFIASDHSPAPPELKCLESGDFVKSWGGIAGLQFLLPVIWTAAIQRGYSIEQLTNWLATRPAAFLELSQKGSIAPGKDADLCVWNPNEQFTVSKESIAFRHSVSPYIGEQLLGTVFQTYVQGKKVYENGTFANLQQGKLLLK